MGPGGLPNIEDSGRDAPNILSELARVRCIFQLRAIGTVIGVMPDMTDECPLNLLEGGADTDASAFAPMTLSTHDDPNSPEVQQDHA